MTAYQQSLVVVRYELKYYYMTKLFQIIVHDYYL